MKSRLSVGSKARFEKEAKINFWNGLLWPEPWPPISISDSLVSTTSKAKEGWPNIEVVRGCPRLSDSYFQCMTVNRFFRIQGISKRITYSTAPQVSCPAAWQVYLLISFTLMERKRTKRQRRLFPLVKNLTGRPPILNLCSISPLLKKHPMKYMNLVGRL